MKLTLTRPAHSALWFVLAATTPRGRAEIRLHSRCMRPTRNLCKSEHTSGGDESLSFREGAIEIPCEDAWKYLKTSIEKLAENGPPPGQGGHKINGIPGQHAEGFDDLFEALEAAEKAAESKP